MMVPLSSRPNVGSTVNLAMSAQKPDPQSDLAKAAQQFEAIFVRQMLAAARKADFGGEESLLGGQGLTTFRQMQDERFAAIAAETGALGIGRMIADRLRAELAPPAASSLAAGPASGGKE